MIYKKRILWQFLMTLIAVGIILYNEDAALWTHLTVMPLLASITSTLVCIHLLDRVLQSKLVEALVTVSFKKYETAESVDDGLDASRDASAKFFGLILWYYATREILMAFINLF